jgi:hypothetical protein
MALKRRVDFKMLQFKDIQFGDGSFVLKGYPGFNMSCYEHIVLHKIVSNLMPRKKFLALIGMFSRIFVEDTFDPKLKSASVNSNSLATVLGKLSLFGIGKLELCTSSKNLLIIKNKNNPFLADEKELFGKNDTIQLDFMALLIEQAFMQYFSKRAIVVHSKGNAGEIYFKVKMSDA